MTYSYDTEKRLTGMSVTDLIAFNYTYNSKQQIVSRDEKYKSGGTWIGFRENFEYDGVNRLLTVTKVGPPDVQTLSMTYQSIITNRIDNKSDAGSYIYESDNNHRLQSFNQNLGSPNHDITYTNTGKVASILERNSNPIPLLLLEYGVDDQRFKSVYKENNVYKCIRYYFNNYEKEVTGTVTRHLNYIYAARNLVGIYEQIGSNNYMHYIYTDQLGSIRCITNSSGVVEQGLSYDAWGNRRDPATGVKYTSVPTGLMFYRGFTGHEHLDELGLINMNGRVYDPAIALFLSPDNFVQSATNSQNFNRYTYCWNNPLKYTDPDGEWIHLVIGGIIGGIQGYMIGKSAGLDGWALLGTTLAGAGVGALSGGVANSGATGGGVMANTMAIAAASHVNSVGMMAIGGAAGVEVPYTLSVGGTSVTMGSQGVEFGYLGKPGNSALENIGYGFGALANIQDIFAWNQGTSVEVYSHNNNPFKGGAPHSYIKGYGIDISVANAVPSGSSNMFQYAWRVITNKKFRTASHFPVHNNGSDWIVKLNNVRAHRLVEKTNNIFAGKGLYGKGTLKFGPGFGCVQHSSRALLASGVWYIPFNPLPQMLTIQLAIRQVGMYTSPYLIDF